MYAHLESVLVNEGDKIAKGQSIAKTGDTGLTTGPHLHFGVYKDGVAVDPLAKR